MPLFSDGSISDIDDLRAYDAAILDVAGVEGVDLSAKLRLASTEIGIELTEFLRKRAGGGSGAVYQTEADVAHVVATPALKHWHTLRTLALIYGDLHGRQLNSRYSEKWKQCRERSRWAADTLFRTGVGLVHVPVAKAGMPELRTVAGTLAPATYHVKVAWKNRTGGTGAPSDTVIHTTETSGVLAVNAVRPPLNAVSYDVYAGLSEADITRQNDLPIDCGQQWTMPETGLIAGEAAGAGQEPDWVLREDRVLQRG
jgi:hypothetical protein